jgi:hypothetical protein
MPYMVNGIGTSVCQSRGKVSWGGPADYDALECFVVLFLPIIPYKAIHTFGWNGDHYRAVPIRWSGELFVRTFVGYWLFVPCIVGVILGLVAFAERAGGMTMLPIAVALVAVPALGWWLLAKTDTRNRNIRRVLGPHELGSSDPATWTNELLDSVRTPRDMFGTASYAEAVERCLRAADYAGAMWAARLCVILEDTDNGQALTDTVLNHPAVEEALLKLRENPYAWGRLMQPMKQTEGQQEA